jgi:hypothetical protein
MSLALLSTLCDGINANDELKRAAALLSTVTTKLRELPSQGDKVHVNAVSLSHRVAAHELKPARPCGLEFEFEKYRPNSCTLVLPLAVNREAATMPATAGAGYSNMHDAGDTMPELNAETARLRPNPEELSIPWSSKKPGAFIDTLLSENQTSDVTGKFEMRNSRFAVLKNIEADEMFFAREPVETRNDQAPMAD